LINFTSFQMILLVLVITALVIMWMELRELRTYRIICQDALEACGFDNVSMFDCHVARMAEVFCHGQK